MVTPDTDPETPKTIWAYEPHIDPALQFDIGRAQVEKLIDDALESGDDATMRSALEQLSAKPGLTSTGQARPSAPASRWTRSHCTSTSASIPQAFSPQSGNA